MRALKITLLSIVLLVLVALGWFMRDHLFPGGATSGNKNAAAMARRGAPPMVVTATAQARDLKDPSQYVGHIEAIQDAEIYAQISGIIKQLHFKEGAMVREGDLLFTIDPERFQAKVELGEATLAQSKSHLSGASSDLAAAEANLVSVQAQLSYARQYLTRLKTAGKRSVMQDDVDKAQSVVLRLEASELQAKAQINRSKASIQQLDAQVRQSEASLKIARIELDYTQVRSPITGQIGRAEVTRGDYVSPGTVLLARVVQVDPVRVKVALSDREYLEIIKNNPDTGLRGLKTGLFLANGDPYRQEGTFDFINNRMDQETSSIMLHMQYPNQSGRLVPGSYVKVMVYQPGAKKAVTIPQQAVLTDNKGEYVYVVNPKSVVEKRHLKLGAMVGTLREVKSGIKAGEKIVVQGLQKVRPGAPVKTAEDKAPGARKGAKS